MIINMNGGGGTQPTGTKSITSNGTYDVTEYASAQVNVPNPSSGTLNITSNGTYNVTNYANASVNVTLDGYHITFAYAYIPIVHYSNVVNNTTSSYFSTTIPSSTSPISDQLYDSSKDKYTIYANVPAKNITFGSSSFTSTRYMGWLYYSTSGLSVHQDIINAFKNVITSDYPGTVYLTVGFYNPVFDYKLYPQGSTSVTGNFLASQGSYNFNGKLKVKVSNGVVTDVTTLAKIQFYLYGPNGSGNQNTYLNLYIKSIELSYT